MMAWELHIKSNAGVSLVRISVEMIASEAAEVEAPGPSSGCYFSLNGPESPSANDDAHVPATPPPSSPTFSCAVGGERGASKWIGGNNCFTRTSRPAHYDE